MSSLGATTIALIFALIVNARTQTAITLLSNVQISFTNNGTHTRFTVSSPLGNGVTVTNAWLAVGLNSASRMVSFISIYTYRFYSIILRVYVPSTRRELVQLFVKTLAQLLLWSIITI